MTRINNALQTIKNHSSSLYQRVLPKEANAAMRAELWLSNIEKNAATALPHSTINNAFDLFSTKGVHVATIKPVRTKNGSLYADIDSASNISYKQQFPAGEWLKIPETMRPKKGMTFPETSVSYQTPGIYYDRKDAFKIGNSGNDRKLSVFDRLKILFSTGGVSISRFSGNESNSSSLTREVSSTYLHGKKIHELVSSLVKLCDKDVVEGNKTNF